MRRFPINIIVRLGDDDYKHNSLITITVFQDAFTFNVYKSIKEAVREYLQTKAGQDWLADYCVKPDINKLDWEDIICGDVLNDIPAEITIRHGFIVENVGTCGMEINGQDLVFGDDGDEG